jgi:hypothetical protein
MNKNSIKFIFIGIQCTAAFLNANNCSDTTYLRLKSTTLQEINAKDFKLFQELDRVCKIELEPNLDSISKNILKPKQEIELQNSKQGKPKNRDSLPLNQRDFPIISVEKNSSSICNFANTKTNSRYSELCATLESNPVLMALWKKGYEAKSKRIGTGAAMMIGGLVGVGLGIAANTEHCDENLFGETRCFQSPLPNPIIGVPSGIIFYWGLYRMLTSGEEINEAIIATDKYFLSLERNQ